MPQTRDASAGAHKGSDNRLAYSVGRAARLLDVGERTLRSMIAAGEVRSIRFGTRRILIPASEIQRLLEG